MTQGFKEQSGRSLKRQTYTWGHRMRNREGGERGGTRPRFCSSFCLQKFPPGRLGPFLILQGWGPTTSPGMLPSKPVHPSPLTWRYSFDVYRLLTFWFTYVLSVSLPSHMSSMRSLWLLLTGESQHQGKDSGYLLTDWRVNETPPKQRPILRLWQFSNPQVIIKWHRNHSGWFMDVRVILFGQEDKHDKNVTDVFNVSSWVTRAMGIPTKRHDFLSNFLSEAERGQ